MTLLSKLMGRHPAKDYYFLSYKTGNIGIACVAVKSKKGFKDLLNYTRISEEQIEFKMPFTQYATDINGEELITTARVRELAIQKTTAFHKDLANFYAQKKEENDKKEQNNHIGISISQKK